MKQKTIDFLLFSIELKIKNLFLTFIYFLFLISALGQTDTNKRSNNKTSFGITVGTTASLVLERLDYEPYLTIEKGKNFFEAGPVIGNNRKIERYWSDSYESVPEKKSSLNGFHFVYQINPNQKAKVFDFFFRVQLAFLNFKSNGIALAGSSNYPNGYLYSDQPFKANQRIISGLFGYGFNIKFLRNFYLSQSVNFGISQNFIHVDYGGGVNNDSKKITPEMMFTLGVGCVFEKKK
jgi:hypothetical protein